MAVLPWHGKRGGGGGREREVEREAGEQFPGPISVIRIHQEVPDPYKWVCVRLAHPKAEEEGSNYNVFYDLFFWFLCLFSLGANEEYLV